MSRFAVALLLPFLLASCSTPSNFKIENDTASAVTLISCVQDGAINLLIPPGGSFTFDDNLGTRTTPDDAGFACLLTTMDGRRVCLTLPTDQSRRSSFRASDAVATVSKAACFARSNAHI